MKEITKMSQLYKKKLQPMKFLNVTQTQLEQLTLFNKNKRHQTFRLWIQRILIRHQDNGILNYFNKYGRSTKIIASSVLMIIVSFLPLLDVFIGLFVDISAIKMNRFPNLGSAIWSFSICVSPLLVLAVSKLKPYWMTYLVTMYVNISSLLGFLFLELNVNMDSKWLFRAISFVLSLILLIICKVILELSQVLILKDQVTYELKRLQK